MPSYLTKLMVLCSLLLTVMLTSQATAPAHAQAFSCANVTEIPQAECQELVALYNGTGGATWSNKAGWLATNTPCSWVGITCSAGHVTQIVLNYYFGNNMAGTVPNFNLPNLTRLDLSRNKLTGSIPDFAQLPQLTSLNLGMNQLTGTIPDFATLSKLTTLGLGDNQLAGSVPDFAALPDLTTLDLSNNQLTGSVPDFAKLSKITTLWLDHNHLSGAMPHWANLSKLGSLHLDHNQLSGVIPNRTWSSFSSLTLNNNCGWVQFDVAQGTVLKSKDSSWAVRNPVCMVVYLPRVGK